MASDFSSKDFDPLAFIKANLNLGSGSKDIQKNADEQVKLTKQILFKMQIMESEAANTL